MGMGLRDALPLLENAGLKVRLQGLGKVKHQSLKPGDAITRGETIVIKLG